MSTSTMWLILGAAALVAGIAILFWLAVARANRHNTVPMCAYCDHPRAAHNGTGCHLRIAVSNGTKACLCGRPYGEPR